MITLKLHEIICSGTHGVYEYEKTKPQRFRINVSFQLTSDRSGETDAFSDTVDWFELKKAIVTLVETKSFNLAEKLATEIADLVLAQEKIQRVSVSVAKLDIWDGGDAGYPSAEVTKDRA